MLVPTPKAPSHVRTQVSAHASRRVIGPRMPSAQMEAPRDAKAAGPGSLVAGLAGHPRRDEPVMWALGPLGA